MITILFQLLHYLIEILRWILIAQMIFSWLAAFNVLDTRNRVVWSIGDFLHRVTEPMLRPIRRYMPNLGPVDISPLALFIVLWVLQQILVRLQMALYGNLAALLM